jgi:hypothetical protein
VVPPKCSDESGEFRTDIKDLHGKFNTIAEKLATIDGRLRGTLPFLATKSDLENHISDHVSKYHSRKTPPKSIVPVKGDTLDKRVMIALLAIVGIFGASFQKLLDVIISFLQK